jgi:hypothetical protein
MTGAVITPPGPACPTEVSSDSGEALPGDGTSTAPRATRNRAGALVVAALVVVAGAAYFFFSNPLFRHSNSWVDPSDLWGIFRGAHYVGWGYLGGVYNPETVMVTFPGIAVVLAPVAMLSDTLHLSSLIGMFVFPHPTAALLLVPAIMVLAATVVVAADALAFELGVSPGRRLVVTVLVGAMAWAATIIWGHPEDALVMTFACYAMVAVQRSQWRRAGWLFGIAIAFQPLIALAVPVFVAASPRGRRLLFAVRCSVLSAFLVGVAFVGNPSNTYRALVKQPTPPSLNHATPWVSLAPHVTMSSSRAAGAGVERSALGIYSTVTAKGHTLLEVAAGPGRTLYVVLALLAGLYVWRRPQDPVRLLWLAGVVLGARCFFEAVMTPYYLTPPLILLLVLAARRGTWRFGVSVLVAAGVSWYAYWHFAPWVWWPPIVVGMTIVMALSRPPAPRVDGEVEDTAPVGSSERGTSTELEPVA